MARDNQPLKIRVIRVNETSYAASFIFRGDERLIAEGLAFDELLGCIATALLTPHQIRYARLPRPWDDNDTHFDLTRDQYEELLA